MPSGTGLSILEKELPEQFIDVGIAEEHAVLSAAGMATSGFHPVCAIYSTFPATRLRPDYPRRCAAKSARDVLYGPCGSLAQ